MVLDVAFPVLFPLFSFLKDKEDALTFITLWFDVEANIAARVLVQFYPPSRTTNSAVWPIFCFLTFYSFLPSFLFLVWILFYHRRRSSRWRRSCVPTTQKASFGCPLFSPLFFFSLVWGGGGLFVLSLSPLSLFFFFFFCATTRKRDDKTL